MLPSFGGPLQPYAVLFLLSVESQDCVGSHKTVVGTLSRFDFADRNTDTIRILVDFIPHGSVNAERRVTTLDYELKLIIHTLTLESIRVDVIFDSILVV